MRKIHYENIFFIGLVHALAVVGLFHFSWGALGVCLALLFTISPLGINLCYHRLLTHRGFKIPLWLEYTFATIAAMSGQGPMFVWVAEHRLHHQFTELPQDPHSPANGGMWHAHMTHLFFRKEFEDDEKQWLRYVPDLTKFRYYHFLNRFHPLFVLLPAPFLYFFGGVDYVLWGIFVRITLMWHITWSVNSISHGFGYRNFETRDTSTNNWLVGLLGFGEGWHNNHHAYPTSSRHGMRWFELDLTYLIILFLEKVGLATQVKTNSLENTNIPLVGQKPVYE